MTNNTLNFKALKQKYASNLTPVNRAAPNTPTQTAHEEKGNPWHAQYQIPAYQRRTQWSAKQALALRGINFNLPKNTITPQTKPLNNPCSCVKKPRNNTEFYSAKRLILSGKMSEVCSILERMEQSGG